MATQGYIPNKPLPQIEKDFKKGGFGTIDNFISNEFSLDVGTIGTFSPAPSLSSQLQSESFQILNDSGNGRVSSGVTSLTIITKILKGVPMASATLFNQTLYTNPYDILDADQNGARTIIYTNLGIVDFVPSAAAVSQATVNTLNTMADQMTQAIINLTFTYDAFIIAALFNSKAVVQAALNYNGN